LLPIQKHISNLLAENECVIVPRLGGFLRIHDNNSLTSGKGKERESESIAFNDLLDYNDGLLVNYLQKQEKISYQEALDEITRFVDSLHERVEEGKEFVVESVGALYKDVDQHIKLHPLKTVFTINETPVVPDRPPVPVLPEEKEPEAPVASSLIEQEALKESDNMDSAEREEVLTEERGNTEIIPVTEEADPPESPDQNQLRKFKLFKRSIAVVSITVTGCILLYSMYLNIAAPPLLGPDLAGLPVAETTTYVNDKANVIEANAGSEKARDKQGSEPSPVIDNPIAGTNSESIVHQSPDQTYSIVAGSFGKRENAIQLMEKLKSDGFSNAVVFSENENRHLVFFETWNDMEKASLSLESIRIIYRDAWVYNH